MWIKKNIKEKYELLSPTEKIIGKAILNGEINILNGSITAISKQLSVSPALINKFCQKLGLSGWKEFKGLAMASLSETFNNSTSGNEYDSSFSTLFNSISEVSSKMNVVIKKIANRISKKRRTIIVAAEYTYKLVSLLEYKLTKLGYNVMVITFANSVRKMYADDHMLFISISGSQTKLNSFIESIPKQVLISCISLGTIKNPRISANYSLGKYYLLPRYEKVFPMTSDVALITILNKIFFEIFNSPENKDINEQIDGHWDI